MSDCKSCWTSQCILGRVSILTVLSFVHYTPTSTHPSSLWSLIFVPFCLNRTNPIKKLIKEESGQKVNHLFFTQQDLSPLFETLRLSSSKVPFTP